MKESQRYQWKNNYKEKYSFHLLIVLPQEFSFDNGWAFINLSLDSFQFIVYHLITLKANKIGLTFLTRIYFL